MKKVLKIPIITALTLSLIPLQSYISLADELEEDYSSIMFEDENILENDEIFDEIDQDSFDYLYDDVENTDEKGDLNEENITDLIDDFKNSNDNIFNEEDIQIEESETKQNSIKKRSKRSISLNTTTTIDSFKIRANDGSAPVNINNNMGSLITKLTIADAAKAGDSFKIEHKI